jgi:ribulose-5-phosphate 4-epimerase/fuculose-1-phosphate aldolase
MMATMIDKKFVIPNYQTFYLSKEESSSPFIQEIAKIGKKPVFSKNTTEVTISMRNGKRLLINAKNSDIKEIKQDDFLEIVDYDPLKNFLLLMGPKEPRSETPIHWIIHNAREDVNATIQITSNKIAEKLTGEIPSTEKEYPPNTLDQIKAILKCLRDSKKVIIKNQGVLFVGRSLKETEELVLETLEKLK